MKVLLWLLHPDPNSRATLKNLQEDKWLSQNIDVNQYSFEAVMNGEYCHLSCAQLWRVKSSQKPLVLHLIYHSHGVC